MFNFKNIFKKRSVKKEMTITKEQLENLSAEEKADILKQLGVTETEKKVETPSAAELAAKEAEKKQAEQIALKQKEFDDAKAAYEKQLADAKATLEAAQKKASEDLEKANAENAELRRTQPTGIPGKGFYKLEDITDPEEKRTAAISNSYRQGYRI